ncbi:MFS transporter [Rhodococcus opacus]|uniref:MFS transporter n=1 Tax=Rhodococcus opacus TaxID=37919 RepID=UPI0024731013|nr:MFS transporter [Rhodococcus opacus]MDH6292346.1 MFS family permease [Rhodococcus opacus]
MAKSSAGPKELRWSLAAASTVTAVFVLSNAPTPLYTRWQAEWGFSSGTLTIVFGAYMVGLIGTLLVAGKLADRYGRKIVLVPGLIAAVTAAGLFLSATDVLWLLAARLLAGAAVGAAVTAGMSATIDLAPDHRRRTGSMIASAAMVFGAGLGPLLSGALSQLIDTPQSWIFGIVLAITTLTLVVAIRLPLHRGFAEDGPVGPLWSWPSVPRPNRRELAWGAAAFAPGITSTSFFLSLGPTVLATGIDAPSPLLAGAAACGMFLVATGIQFALAHLRTRTHLALSSAAAFVSMATLTASVTISPTPTLFVIAALLAGAAQGLGQLAALTLIGTRIASNHRAEANATLNIAGYIPAALLPVGTGYLIQFLPFSAAIITFAAAVMAFSLAALITVRISTAEHLSPGALDEHVIRGETDAATEEALLEKARP